MNNLIKTRIVQMARATRTELSPLHYQILTFASDYYTQNKVGPMYHIIRKKFGVSKEDLEKMFPNGLFSVFTWVNIPIQTPDQICKHIAEVEVKEKKNIYFDHNATTYVREEVAKVLTDYFNGKFGFGNPSSSNEIGREAYEHVFNARTTLAKIIKCDPEEIIFTASGSEAINLAIKGIAFNHYDKKGHIISSKYEHPAVLNTLSWLSESGFEITLLDVKENGLVDPGKLESAIKENTILVSIMTVNNEIGTINNFEELGKICKVKNIPFMTDAIQAFGKIHIHPSQSNISLMPVSGHKFYAPKGIGLLYADKNIKLSPIVHGGGQEKGLRSGTENVPYIMALAKAAFLSYHEMHNEFDRLKKLQTYFIKKLNSSGIEYTINGSLESRMPHNLNVGFKGIDSGALMLSLNHIGIYVSSGSACHEGSREASHVLRAIKADTENYGSIRFSFGLITKQDDVDYLFDYMPEIIKKLKNPA